ncbi:hypothetical protein V3481_006824 [Fusarium oxysporum f. sp. vasinfectum]
MASIAACCLHVPSVLETLASSDRVQSLTSPHAECGDGLKKLMKASRFAADGLSRRICSKMISHVVTTELETVSSRRTTPASLLRRLSSFLSLSRKSSRYVFTDARGTRRLMYAAACWKTGNPPYLQDSDC